MGRIVLISSAVLLLAFAPWTAADVQRPPERFQISPGLSPALVWYADPETVDAACKGLTGDANPKFVILACTLPVERKQLLPNPCLYPDEYFASLVCHENAHLSGWAHEAD